MNGWRLILSGRASGSFNMALDEAIMQCFRKGAPPTLRLYGWSPACVSVGYFQSVDRDIDMEGCRRLGIDVVRRPTGGRAILHDDELTYSVAGSLDDPHLSGSVNQSYRKIAAAIAEGLSIMGVEVEEWGTAPGPWGRAETGACFGAVWGHELSVGGRKLVASAQTRRGGVVLQHGSILLGVDLSGLASVLKTGDKRSMESTLRSRLTTLSELLGRRVDAKEAAAALQLGFERALGVALEEGQPTDEEMALAASLMTEKYGKPAWNLARAARGMG
ncbi:MAG: biotin/lipoate A/B protein ligase family protein [Dehalococcoidia bacterium]|nr:biotin/lipoate A/B protein ligase family protein [Dehalococcoidia bacterium]